MGSDKYTDRGVMRAMEVEKTVDRKAEFKRLFTLELVKHLVSNPEMAHGTSYNVVDLAIFLSDECAKKGLL